MTTITEPTTPIEDNEVLVQYLSKPNITGGYSSILNIHKNIADLSIECLEKYVEGTVDYALVRIENDNLEMLYVFDTRKGFKYEIHSPFSIIDKSISRDEAIKLIEELKVSRMRSLDEG